MLTASTANFHVAIMKKKKGNNKGLLLEGEAREIWAQETFPFGKLLYGELLQKTELIHEGDFCFPFAQTCPTHAHVHRLSA